MEQERLFDSLNKAQMEDSEMEFLEQRNIDLIVFARYKQVVAAVRRTLPPKNH
jgi:formyltetrahydrofolate hydrolase